MLPRFDVYFFHCSADAKLFMHPWNWYRNTHEIELYTIFLTYCYHSYHCLLLLILTGITLSITTTTIPRHTHTHTSYPTLIEFKFVIRKNIPKCSRDGWIWDTRDFLSYRPKLNSNNISADGNIPYFSCLRQVLFCLVLFQHVYGRNL